MGPLAGLKVIEVLGMGPGPFCGMMLADMGAEVVRVDRKGHSSLFGAPKYDVLGRGRRSIALDLKKSGGIEIVLRLAGKADALFEGFRAGVMEKLGLGPDVCMARNPRLVYGRMTGWGQDGPLAKAAGHDINYTALSGALHAVGPRGGKPVPPLNYAGDYGGGGMLLAFGMVCALWEAQRSGKGQVVDAAMVDGSAILTSVFYGLRASGVWNDERGTNLLDGGAHFYTTYETADGKWVAIGALEPQFYALLLQHAGMRDSGLEDQMDRAKWPEFEEKLAAVFKTKTRDEWCRIMEGTDVCFAPVLTFGEAPTHPHNAARRVFTELEGVPQPAPAPRFSRTHAQIQGPTPKSGEHTESILTEWGFDQSELDALRNDGAI
ncbi:MAG: alpha-methylacyl-CoA racemase [Candidatus Hydrogenedentes bacterium]|nr:alpha-methylacyl-CoA racemase [Candidatus Hydrogenedentota bacterium]